MEYNTQKYRNAEINARVLNLMYIYILQLNNYIYFFFLPPDPVSFRMDRLT